MSGVDIAAVQTRVISLLRAANVLGAATTDATRRVYDDVPMNITTGVGPYVEISAGMDSEDDSTVSDGVEHILTLNVWSEWKGFKELKLAAKAIRDALHRYSFDSGNMHVIMWVDSAQYLNAEDGVTRQCVIRVRCSCRT